MNNFKKLLASAMALTMVTSVMPVNAATDFTTDTYCEAANVNLVARLMDRVPDLTSVNAETLVNITGTSEESLFNYVTANAKAIAGVAGCYTIDSEVRTYAQTLVGMISGIEAIFEGTTWSKIDSTLNGGWISATVKIDDVEDILGQSVDSDGVSAWVKDYTDAALAYNAFLNDFEYEGNLIEAQAEQLDDVKAELEDQLDAYGYSSADRLDDYVDELEKDFEDFTEANSEVVLAGNIDANIAKNTTSESAVRAHIRLLQSTSDYRLFQNEEAVQAIFEQYDEILENIELVDDVTDSRNNDAYNAIIRKTAGSSVVTRVEKLISDAEKNTTDAEKLSAVMSGLKIADYELLKEFKEEVIDTVWTFETRQYGDYYVNRSNASSYVTSTTLNDVFEDFGIYLITNFDREEGTFGWDQLDAYMTEVVNNYNALTEGIEGIDAINVAVDDREVILAADDALYFFEENGTENLTTAQKRDVRDAQRKVDELLEAYRSKFGSVGTTTGWVDMGNGNWNYYEADGTAPTKWICTAPNTWYYVQNGNMMRNYWVWRDANSAYFVGDDGVMVYGPTTVNGYELDANGLWHR